MDKFADRVQAEGAAQRELRSQGRPIPPELRVMARKSGCILTLVPLVGAVLVALLGALYDSLYYGVVIFFLALSAMGIVQVLTGRHFPSGDKEK